MILALEFFDCLKANCNLAWWFLIDVPERPHLPGFSFPPLSELSTGHLSNLKSEIFIFGWVILRRTPGKSDHQEHWRTLFHLNVE